MPSPDLVCPSCAHTNPAGSKFCNRCGVPVHFRNCAGCDAVNDVAARACHKCGRAFEAKPLATPVTRIDVRTSTGMQVTVAVAALAGLATLLFFAYQEDPQAADTAPVLVAMPPVDSYVEPRTISLDDASDARLAALTRPIVKPAKVTAKAATPPRKATTTKPRPVRSQRAP